VLKGDSLMDAWHHVVAIVTGVPAPVWAGLAVANAAATVAAWSAARRRMRRSGQRAANPDLVAGRAKAKDTALTVAAIIPAGLCWTMVLAGRAVAGACCTTRRAGAWSRAPVVPVAAQAAVAARRAAAQTSHPAQADRAARTDQRARTDRPVGEREQHRSAVLAELADRFDADGPC
jgi:hypothetical protein